MAVLEKLAELGFTNAEILSEAKGVSLARVRTSRGWTYERFSDDASVIQWAQLHQPENV